MSIKMYQPSISSNRKEEKLYYGLKISCEICSQEKIRTQILKVSDGEKRKEKYKLMKQATKRIIGSLIVVCLVVILFLMSTKSKAANDNAANETELVNETNSAFAGASEVTMIMLIDAEISEDSHNAETVGVPLEECEITEDGEIIEPEFEPYEMYVNVSFLNVRSSPSLESDVIGKLNINDKVYVMGETEGDDVDWLIIYYEGGIDSLGFISSEYTQETAPELDTYNNEWTGKKLNKHDGTVQGPSGKETYYNLNMAKCIYYMQQLGYYGKYWIRSDGAKMYTTNEGSFVMCAACLKLHPKGSLVETTLGTAIVVDTGEFASYNQNQIDICTNWK